MDNSKNILFGDSTSTKSVKNSVAVVYYIYLIIIALLQILFSVNQPEQDIIWNYAPFVMGIGLISLLTHFKFPQETFLVNTIIIFSVLLFIKFSVIYTTGFSPVQYLMAVALCLTVVYFYDYRRSFIIPLLFILFDLAELLFFQELRYSPIAERISSSLERITYTAVSLNFYIFIISNFFSSKLGHLINKYKEKEQKIKQTRKEEAESLERLKDEYKKIEDAVTTNSHKVRAPISRIQGLLSLQQAELEDEDAVSEEDTIDLKEELKKSLVELRGELEAFEQTIRNAENERSTSYQELIDDESVDFDDERFKEDDNLFS